MANFGSPAHQAAMGNLPGMMLIASASVGLVNALGAAADAARDARYQSAYGVALQHATAHAADMENLARVAVGLVAELEAEVARLSEACMQSQEVIDSLVVRA